MSQGESGAIETMEQLTGMWTALIEDRGQRPFTRDGIVHLWADSPFGFYNTLAIVDSDVDASDLERRLSKVAAFMRAKPDPGYLYISEELLTPDARTTLRETAEWVGLSEAMKVAGMAGDVLPVGEPEHAELSFQRVGSQEQLDAYATINAHAYGMPDGPAREAFRDSSLWLNDIHAYLGYVGGATGLLRWKLPCR